VSFFVLLFATGPLGQESASFTLCGKNCSFPTEVAIDPTTNNDLYIADQNNSRVLRYGPLSAGASASVLAVFGQPNYTSTSRLPAAPNTLLIPTGVFVDNKGTLWVVGMFFFFF